MTDKHVRTTLSSQSKMALNAICPYFTMFPLEYPLTILRKHRQRNPVVMDPFCGRGTTLFAARHLNLQSWGIDSSPVAVAIAKAKLAMASFDETIDLAASLIYGVTPRAVPQSAFFAEAFHANTLRQLCSIREGLLETKKDSNASVLLRAAMLGCLHGPKTNNPATASYFSNQMPRSYAPKPRYALRFWKKYRMRAWRLNVLSVVARKLLRVCNSIEETGNSHFQVRLGDSRLRSSLPQGGRSFSLVITSPPYYGMRTYVPDQWLRNWFLGGPSKIEYGGHLQLSHEGPDTFAKSLAKVWRNMAITQSRVLEMYVRFGAIPSARKDAKELFLNSLEESGSKWKCVYTREAATAEAGKRQANQWANSQAILEYDFHVSRSG